MLRPDDTATGRLGPSASSADPGLVLAVDIGTTGVKVEVVDTAAVSNCGASANTRREPATGVGGAGSGVHRRGDAGRRLRGRGPDRGHGPDRGRVFCYALVPGGG